MRADILTVTWNTNFKIHQAAKMVACAKSVLLKIFIFGHRLIHHPQRVPGYLSSFESRNDEVASMYATFQFLLKTNFGKRSFSHALSHEWKRVPFKANIR